MQSKYRLLIVAVLALLSTVYVIKQFVFSPAVNAPANILLDARFSTLDGKEVALKTWRNKVIVLNFWATWCPPCREEMPELSNFYTENSSKNVVVIGIAIDEAKAVKSYLKKTKVMYPILVDEEKGVILSKNLGNNQGILPYTVIINSNGSVQKTIFGRIHKDQLDATLKPLLQPSKSL